MVFLLRSLFAKMEAALSRAYGMPEGKLISRRRVVNPLKRLEDVVLNENYITDEEVKAYEGLENKEDYEDKYWKLENRFKNLRAFFNGASANFIGYRKEDVGKVLEVYDKLKSKYDGKTFRNNQIKADYERLMWDIEDYLIRTGDKYEHVLDLERETDSEVEELIKILNYDVEEGEQENYAKYWKVKDWVEVKEDGRRELHKGRISLLRDKIKEMKRYGRTLPETVQDLYLFSKEIEKLSEGKLSRYEGELEWLNGEVDILMRFKSRELKIPLDYLKSDKRVMGKEVFLMEEALKDFKSRFETYINYPDPIEVYRVARSFFCSRDPTQEEAVLNNFRNICKITKSLLEEEKEVMLGLAGDQGFVNKIGIQFLRVLHNRLDRGHQGITGISDLSKIVEGGRFNEFFGEEEKEELEGNICGVIGKRNGNLENVSRLLVYHVVNCSVRNVDRFLAHQDSFLNKKDSSIKDTSGTFGRYFGQVIRSSIDSPDLFKGLITKLFTKTRKKLRAEVYKNYGPSAFERLDELVTH